MIARLLLALPLGLLALLAASGASAQTSYSDRVMGMEVPPVSSTRGTFVGVAAGGLPGQWRVQIVHQPLASGTSVAISGGTFTLHTPPMSNSTPRTLTGTVSGGSVTVVNPGARCTNQVYTVDALLTVGRFTGTLTHHRRPLFGRCLVYAATLTGSATLNG